jgi:DNA gyrase/topoisomerase IV subunit B
MALDYSGKDIQILRGLEPVRFRPGMYIGNTSLGGLHHLFAEVLDNAVDEALNGHCNRIEVELLADNWLTVRDNGRGIPVDMHPEAGRNTLEIIMTTLHAGGKFSTKSYKVSGGLHGVGISVVTALSDLMTVRVQRDGHIWEQKFSRGRPQTELQIVGETSQTGTQISFHPDPDIFKDIAFRKQLIREYVQAKAFLCKGLRLVVTDRSGTISDREAFYFQEGIKDYLQMLLAERPKITGEPFYFEYQNEGDWRLEMAFCWTEQTERVIRSYANSIYTVAGGSHETGFRMGLLKALRDFIHRQPNWQRQLRGMRGDDLTEGLVAVVSVFVSGNLEFQGQTKERLNSDIQPQVENVVRSAFENYLFHNPNTAESILRRLHLSLQAREASRKAREAVQSKTSSQRLNLPGKLADCSSKVVAERELFLVEGDSAGGSSKQARDRRIQAILPLKGKILNVEQASLDKISKNQEIQHLTQCIGTGIGSQFNYSKLRYHKIFINCDADVDGYHISTLLLTFFYRYMPELIAKGHIYLARPPLYRLRIGAGKKIQTLYAYSDTEKERFLKQYRRAKIDVQRFKGLGEMNAKELQETTMDPAKRLTLQVTLTDAARTEEVFQTLLGKDVAKRYQYIQENAVFVKNQIDV